MLWRDITRDGWLYVRSQCQKSTTDLNYQVDATELTIFDIEDNVTVKDMQDSCRFNHWIYAQGTYTL
jgi:hypothetical protein